MLEVHIETGLICWKLPFLWAMLMLVTLFLLYQLLVVACQVGSFDCPKGCLCKEYRYNSTDVETARYIGLVLICEPSSSDDDVRQLFNSLPNNTASLTFRSSGLTELTDFCCLSNVEELDLSYNSISDAASYYQYLSVKTLRFQHNRFSVLRKDEFISFPNVVSLWLDENQIEHIDQEAFRLLNLRSLYLRSNRITFVSEAVFRFMPSLERLDLSNNFIFALRSRNFFYCIGLKHLDLSGNDIYDIDEKAFAPLSNLVDLNLADNALTRLPTEALKGFKWRKLIFDGNPLSSLPVDIFNNVQVQSLSMNRLTDLAVVPKEAFRGIKKVRHLTMSHCPSLQYFSLLWIEECSCSIEKIVLTDNRLQLIPHLSRTMENIAQIELHGNQLRCDCMDDQMLRNWSQAILGLSCNDKSSISAGNGNCRTPTLLPTGLTEVTGRVGETASLFCIFIANGTTLNPAWQLPNGSTIYATQTFDRILVSQEQLVLRQLTPKDSGSYKCIYGAPDSSLHRRINLRIEAPDIVLYPLEVSWQSITVAWNGSMASWGRGEFSLRINSTTNDAFFTVPLPSYGHMYTATRLLPSSNYTFCVAYSQAQVDYYTFCVDVQTDEYSPSIRTKFSYGIILLLFSTVCLICIFCVVRFLQRRLFIWEEEKARAKVHQSMSGESFLTSGTSLSSPLGMTYENLKATSGSFDSHTSMLHKCEASTSSSSDQRHIQLQDLDLCTNRARPNISRTGECVTFKPSSEVQF
uniref:Ig-like domain-containing protein n=1 Tax=Trichuris muris TaxID=70415 RepID=A0A5S6QTS3_TRIMR